ncbi:MAG: hypothetical protein ABFS86_16755 [Planctomycetota bacterium]
MNRRSCTSCGAGLTHHDRECPECGAAIPERERQARRADHRRARRSGQRAMSYAERARGTAVQRAAFWILVLAVVYGAGGLLFGFLAKTGADQELARLAVQGDATPIQLVDGRLTTVGEYRSEVYGPLLFFFLLNMGLAAGFFVCWFVTKTNPVGGTVAAFSLFVLVIGLGALFDPHSIYHGWLIKIFAVIALVGGMKAAFAQAAMEKQGERPLRRRRAAR